MRKLRIHFLIFISSFFQHLHPPATETVQIRKDKIKQLGKEVNMAKEEIR
jgi:hypothetical protein